MDSLIKINQLDAASVLKEITEPYYFILQFDGATSFSVDFTAYACTGKTLLFLSPYQLLQWHQSAAPFVNVLRFHGDFYCIEYHKKEVACNGVLFNNIYQQPFVSVSAAVYEEIGSIIEKIRQLGQSERSEDVSIMKAYLQLILALSNKEKQRTAAQPIEETAHQESVLTFQSLLDQHFLQTKEVSFYASQFGLTVDTFSKKIKKHFGKPPSKLIQERVILEAKKLLHLTFKPIKEIAAELNFEDEFYFSRYFKKEVGISPKKFREEVGISIVAKSSMD